MGTSSLLGDLPNLLVYGERERSFLLKETMVAGAIPLVTICPVVGGLLHELLVIYGGTKEKDFRKVVKVNWAEELASLGYQVYCFDFRSNLAEDFYQFGLFDRIMDTARVTNWLLNRPFKYPLTLVGVSMGGHIATQLAGELGNKIANLILVAPAAYHDKAVQPNVKFSPPETWKDNNNPAGKFTRIIKGYVEDGDLTGRYFPGGWKESSVFSMARRVTVPTLVIRFTQDEVAGEVPHVYFESFLRRGADFDGLSRMVVRPGGHGGTFTDPERIEFLLKEIVNFIG